MRVVFQVRLCVLLGLQLAANADKLELNILDGEYWWAGRSSQGHMTPYDVSTKVTHDRYQSLGTELRKLIFRGAQIC